MITPKAARLEVVVAIDPDVWDEYVAKGYSLDDMKELIKKSVTIATPDLRGPVTDIESVQLNYWVLKIMEAANAKR